RIERIRQAAEGLPKTIEHFRNLVHSRYKEYFDEGDAASKSEEAIKLKMAVTPARKALIDFQKERNRLLQYARKRFDGHIRGVQGALRNARQHRDVGQFEPDGRPRWLAEAKCTLDVTSALGPENPSLVEGMSVEYKVVLEKSNAVYEDLREEVIDKTRTPDDRYRGADRDRLAAAIEQAWRKRWPKDKPVGLRFHAADWKRQVSWQWNDAQRAWLKNDVSVLPVTVVVENPNDGKALLLYYAYLNKDHTKGGAVNIGVDTKSGSYVVREMLKANYRP
ncbi:MAG: hypothetical protein ACYTG0_43485, partial [Planctomycetota bacterium]